MPDPHRVRLPEISALLLTALEKGESAAVVVALSHSDPGRIGSRLLVTGAEVSGGFDDARAERESVRLARRALAGDPGISSGTYPVPAAGGGKMDIFLDLHHPSRELIIVGAGHVAQPLCTMGALLGLRVTVLDDRPEFATRERFPEAHALLGMDFSRPFEGLVLHRWTHVVLVTRGHKYDYECLRRVLQNESLPAYVGMIGSRRRVRATFDALLAEGISRERLALVHAPIGLDIGGETPAEIAVSVVAELVHHWRDGSCRPLSQIEHVLERFHPPGKERGTETP
jgi:xanthine dehydrogenase accessory factor